MSEEIEYEKFNEPYEIVRGVKDGRLVEITIRAVGDDVELTYDEIREATRQILDRYRRENVRSSALTARTDSKAVRELVRAHAKADGRVTDEYLARLAVAYEELVPQGRAVSVALTAALGSKLPTVKGHIMRARREGFLTNAEGGKEGGEATPKARELLAALSRT